MDQRTIQILFALLRSAICGTMLTEKERRLYTPDMLHDILRISSKHDVTHLIAIGMIRNELAPNEHNGLERHILNSIYRYEKTQYEYENLCAAFEKQAIPFLPLKGSVIRRYYPEAWMRTSCDIDILLQRADLDSAISYLIDHHNYVVKERATHDVSLLSPAGITLELHFDLVEEGRAQNAIDVLNAVWEKVALRENSKFCYEMQEDYFYFYHIAHMAKHFENGGCGIRPFIDLWILDNVAKVDRLSCDKLLQKGDLLKFANVSRKLSEIWLECKEPDERSLQMQDYLMHGGVYGSTDNRVAFQQRKRGGRIGYLLSRIFVPYAKLKRYYPILENHKWLMPAMQIRRWFMLLKPEVARMAKSEIAINKALDSTYAVQMRELQEKVGL